MHPGGVQLRHPRLRIVRRCLLQLLPSNFTNPTNSFNPTGATLAHTLFAATVGAYAVEAVEPTLQEQIISSYPTDAVASQHISDSQHPWSCSKDGLLFYKGPIYIPESFSSLRMDILQEYHDAPLAGHPGIAKTVELITRNYWFPDINSFTKDYINSCHLCQQGKAQRHLRHGESAPLPILDAPWKGLSCDFITDLPVSNGKDSILVFVDRMTKMIHFIPCSESILFLSSHAPTNPFGPSVFTSLNLQFHLA